MDLNASDVHYGWSSSEPAFELGLPRAFVTCASPRRSQRSSARILRSPSASRPPSSAGERRRSRRVATTSTRRAARWRSCTRHSAGRGGRAGTTRGPRRGVFLSAPCSAVLCIPPPFFTRFKISAIVSLHRDRIFAVVEEKQNDGSEE